MAAAAASMRSRRALPAPARRRSSMPPARCGASIRTCWCRRTSRRTSARSNGPRNCFRERKNYLDIYDHHGLIGRRAVLAHGVHLRRRRDLPLPRERHRAGALPDLEPVSRLRAVPDRATSRTRAARCKSGSAPISAAAPASRCSPRWARLTRSRSSTAARLSAVEAFYLATLGGARALALDDGSAAIAPGQRGRPGGARSKGDAAADATQRTRANRSKTCCSP